MRSCSRRAAMRAGSRAMGICEPGQDREVAALSGPFHVPRGGPEGAGHRRALGGLSSKVGARSHQSRW